MGRITLYTKLQRNGQLESILNEVKNVDKPIEFLRQKLEISYPCAKKFIEEAGLSEVFQEKKVAKVFKKRSRFNESHVDLLINDLEFKLKNPTDIVIIRDTIERWPLNGLKLLFKKLTGKKAKTKLKTLLANGCCYYIQNEYYGQMYNYVDMPESVRERAALAIEVCYK